MADIRQAVKAKLKNEGVAITDPWPKIEAVLSKVVMPTACIESARGMRADIVKELEETLEQLRWDLVFGLEQQKAGTLEQIKLYEAEIAEMTE